MAGTIVADTIQTGAGASTAMANAVNGSAKAWVAFSAASTPTVYKSYNVSSVVFVSTGVYTINLTAGAVSDSNYVLFACGTDDNLAPIYGCESGTYGQYRSTSGFRMGFVNNGGTLINHTGNYVSVFD